VKDRSRLFTPWLLAGALSVFVAAGWVAAELTFGKLLDEDALSAARIAAGFIANNIITGLLLAAAFGIPAAAWYRQYKLLRLRKAELREKNLQLDRAVNNIPQALIMFDSDARLVLCSDRYRQMYGLPPEMVRPGTSLHSLLLRRKELGNFPYDPDRYCADTLVDIATGRTTSRTVELGDGRVIVLINKPLAGGAWVSTHQDITELHQAQKEVQQSHARLAAVIEAMPAGLILYDDQHRLVLWNKCYDESKHL
jgi:PAS domain-containing protein